MSVLNVRIPHTVNLLAAIIGIIRGLESTGFTGAETTYVNAIDTVLPFAVHVFFFCAQARLCDTGGLGVCNSVSAQLSSFLSFEPPTRDSLSAVVRVT